jgi:hypothetical protein
MDKLYKSYFKKIRGYEKEMTEKSYLLNNDDRKALKKVKFKTLFWSAIYGALGVIFYFLPIHLYPEIFPKINLNKWFSIDFVLEYGQIFYGVILMIIELHLLTILHLKAVNKMAVLTRFYDLSALENKEDFLFQLGMDAKELGLNDYGIDPYQEVNKNLLMFFTFLIKLKGFFANKLMQYLIKRLMGRYAIRYVVDYVGVPVYMVINAYGTNIILKKTLICIMGSNLINTYVSKLRLKNINESEKELIYDSLQLIAMSKRDYHQNHFILTQKLFNYFEIKPKKKHIFTNVYYQKLSKSSKEIQQICQEILILGFILDGNFSRNEEKKIKILNDFGLIIQTSSQLKVLNKKFLNGEEFELL